MRRSITGEIDLLYAQEPRHGKRTDPRMDGRRSRSGVDSGTPGALEDLRRQPGDGDTVSRSPSELEVRADHG